MNSPLPRRTAFRFTSLLILILVLSAIMTLLSKPGGSSDRGGLEVGQTLPVIHAEGWVNGAPPDLQGKVVVIDAWATWCVPCRLAAPHLVETYQQFADRDDVVFIGLTSEGETQLPAIQHFLEQAEITWPNGYAALQTLSDLKAHYVPSMWVVNRQGKIVWNSGSQGELAAAIEKALKD